MKRGPTSSSEVSETVSSPTSSSVETEAVVGPNSIFGGPRGEVGSTVSSAGVEVGVDEQIL